jgi:hypothetical protein
MKRTFTVMMMKLATQGAAWQDLSPAEVKAYTEKALRNRAEHLKLHGPTIPVRPSLTHATHATQSPLLFITHPQHNLLSLRRTPAPFCCACSLRNEIAAHPSISLRGSNAQVLGATASSHSTFDVAPFAY